MVGNFRSKPEYPQAVSTLDAKPKCMKGKGIMAGNISHGNSSNYPFHKGSRINRLRTGIKSMEIFHGLSPLNRQFIHGFYYLIHSIGLITPLDPTTYLAT